MTAKTRLTKLELALKRPVRIVITHVVIGNAPPANTESAGGPNRPVMEIVIGGAWPGLPRP